MPNIPTTSITDVIDDILTHSAKMGGVERDIKNILSNNILGCEVMTLNANSFSFRIKSNWEYAYRTPIVIAVTGQVSNDFDLIIIHPAAGAGTTNFYKSLCDKVSGIEVTVNEDNSKTFTVHLKGTAWWGYGFALYLKSWLELKRPN